MVKSIKSNSKILFWWGALMTLILFPVKNELILELFSFLILECVSDTDANIY